MYKKEFDELLKKSLPRAVLLYGEEYFLSFYLKLYKERLGILEEILTQYYDEYDFSQAKSYLSQSSLFGGENLLIIRSSKALPKKELDSLIELTQRNFSNYFLLLFDGEAKDAKKMHKSFEKSGVWVRFFAPNHKEAKEILIQKAKLLNLDITYEAIEYLLDSLEYNLSLATKELEKLSTLNIKITKKEVEIFGSSISLATVEALIADIFYKKDLVKTLANLLELGSSEFEILRAIEIFVNQIFLFHSYIKAYGVAPSSQEVLGYTLPKALLEQRVSLAMKIKLSTLNQIYEHLLESEIRLKKAPPQTREAILFGSLIKLQKLL